MLFGLLLTLFLIVCFFLVLIILIQKGKGSTGLGSLGGGTQMLFGGGGGQDIFQKITWGLCAFFLFGSMILALMKSAGVQESRYMRAQTGSASEQPMMPQESESESHEAGTQE
jgi:preprotein translocase subunit SecG